MTQVSQLAEQIPEVKRFRASRRNKLKRTFVGAGDAVQAKLQKTDAPRKLEKEVEDWNRTEIEQNKLEFRLKFDESQKSENLKELLKDIGKHNVYAIELITKLSLLKFSLRSLKAITMGR